MKKIVLFSLAALLVVSCKVDDVYYGTYPEEYTPPYNIDWNAAADSSTNMVLIDHFFMWQEDALWIDNRWAWGYFNPDSDKMSTANNAYWGQAHSIDVVTDAYNRTGDPYYSDIMQKWFEGVPQWQYGKGYSDPQGYPNNGWYNPFIDDMEWIVLAQLRMWEATGIQEYFDVAKYIYDSWIITTWDYDENGGGILWSHSADKSKNACSNGPAAIIAARLYNYTQDEKYLDDAKMIYDWLKATLYTPSTGMVADNMTNGVKNGGALSYNQGTFLGAAHELYKITGRSSYLKEAVKAGEYATENSSQLDASGKLLVGADPGDLGLFKGILVRYLTLLTNEPTLDKETRKKFHDFLYYQACILWTEGVIKDDPDGYGMLYTGYLDEPGYFSGDFTVNTAGATIIEVMSILEPVD